MPDRQDASIASFPGVPIKGAGTCQPPSSQLPGRPAGLGGLRDSDLLRVRVSPRELHSAWPLWPNLEHLEVVLAVSEHSSVLVVGSDPEVRGRLIEELQVLAGRLINVAGFEQATRLVETEHPDVVVVDLDPDPGAALSLVRRAAERPGVIVVAVSRLDRAQRAVEAFRAGATEFVLYPFEPGELVGVLEQRLRATQAMGGGMVSADGSRRGGFPEIVAESEAMRRVLDLIEMVAPLDTTVLIEGESGTGKELVARAIHERSPRREFPFIAVNSAALPEGLLESELFGHVKGSFTSATSNRLGLFAQADRGTIFLDEIGDISPAMQAKLLRVLQNGEIRPVGSSEAIRIDVRLIAATNRTLSHMVSGGGFREDLFYRLNVITINLEPLRERREDIMPLARRALDLLARKVRRGPLTLSPEARQALLEYSWPGNVRELENVLERAAILAKSEVIEIWDLPRALQGAEKRTHGVPLWEASLADVESEHIRRVLRACKGNRTKAARTLGISRSTLWRKMQQYGIEAPKP